METYCRRSKCDTTDYVIILAEAFETSTLNRRRNDRPFDEEKTKSSRRRRRPATPSSEESSSLEESSELEDSSSSENERQRKKATGKKKGKTMAMPPKSLAAIVSQLDALVKDFADLKVHVVGGQDRRKLLSRLRANLWCTTCGKEALAPTPIPPTHISRYAPKDMATTVAQRRMVPPGDLARPPPDAHGGKTRNAAVAAVSPHYDIVRNIGEQRLNITFQQLWNDNKTYRKLLAVAMRRPRQLRPTKLPKVNHAKNEDLGPPEIEVEIYQTRRKPLEMLRNIPTTIGDVTFLLTYTILKPLMKMGYDVLIGRPWLYGARICSD
ncbi:hypothetical protein AXG93_3390s1030 [Marchantia polymorpha subsp. ruderalis]|uniref:Uncharacterized protein n=1 Tax=Marchantia polymorpha subsp. ruderalis TaxID=1480154 RepID=A0A176VQZ7_MARPO|nr:hypothetical protein AXG93_3390s1030 [Marchantia polymorpha subsp. ruderalis]